MGTACPRRGIVPEGPPGIHATLRRAGRGRYVLDSSRRARSPWIALPGETLRLGLCAVDPPPGRHETSLSFRYSTCWTLEPGDVPEVFAGFPRRPALEQSSIPAEVPSR